MQFTRRLRSSIHHGEITTSIRIWQDPLVKVGNRYPMEDGYIAVDAIHEIALEDITPNLARESGFSSVPDLLRVAAVTKSLPNGFSISAFYSGTDESDAYRGFLSLRNTVSDSDIAEGTFVASIGKSF